jgi:hypothetical protein
MIYDYLEWSFLLKVLRHFGFFVIFSDLWLILSRIQQSYQCCVRGVRQSDPLSPLPSGLAEEVLSRFITQAKVDGSISAMLFCRGIEVPTHVLYVDNILIFCKGSLSNFRCLLDIFNAYALVTSQVCLAQLRARFSQVLSPMEDFSTSLLC